MRVYRPRLPKSLSYILWKVPKYHTTTTVQMPQNTSSTEVHNNSGRQVNQPFLAGTSIKLWSAEPTAALYARPTLNFQTYSTQPISWIIVAPSLLYWAFLCITLPPNSVQRFQETGNCLAFALPLLSYFQKSTFKVWVTHLRVSLNYRYILIYSRKSYMLLFRIF